MTFDRNDVQKEVVAQLQDDAKFITPSEVDLFIAQALRQLDRDRPLSRVEDITGDGTKSYDLAPIGYQKGVSRIVKIEFPAGEDPPIKPLIEDDDYLDGYEDPSKPVGERIRLLFITVTPVSTEKIRVTFRTIWTLDPTDATKSNLDEFAFAAVVHKSTSLALRALSNLFAQGVDSGIAADAVDRTAQSSLFAFNAREHDNMYDKLAGLSDDVGAAQAIAESDIRFAHGEDFFWHPARTR